MPAPQVVPPDFPPPFAAEWGQDEHGLFIAFAVDRVVQRMRWIEPGSFMMGSPLNEVGRYDDEVQHRVELTEGIWLGDTPVTQALWQAVVGTNPSRFKGSDNPVESVSWFDCEQFVQRLNERVDGLDARLPTEAEWEYACRAGTTTATWIGDLHKGEDVRAPLLDSIAWYSGNAGGSTHPVAQKAANPWGLYDMLGNVYEWCADWKAAYPSNTVRDPVGPAQRADRVLRGGSWFSSARYVRASYREADSPDYRDALIGLRLARGPAPSQGSGATSKRGADRRAESPRQGGAGRGTTP